MVDAFEEAPAIQRVPTWEDGSTPAFSGGGLEGDQGEHAVIAQMVALGYLEPLSADAARNVAQVGWDARLALATVFLSTHRPSRALPLLEALHAERPADGRTVLLLAQCLYHLDRAAECAALLQARSAQETGDPAAREILLGSALLALGDAAEARLRLSTAETLAPNNANAPVLSGEASLATKQWDQAETAFRRALVLDADNVQAYDGLTSVHLEQRRYLEAAQSALEAVGRLHFFPAAHFRLGLALVGLGDHARAVQAFETSLTMAPGQRDAHRWAATLHRKLGNRDKAAEHRRAAESLPRRT